LGKFNTGKFESTITKVLIREREREREREEAREGGREADMRKLDCERGKDASNESANEL